MLRRAAGVLWPQSGAIPMLLPQVVARTGPQQRSYCQASPPPSTSFTSLIIAEFQRDPEQAAASVAALPEAVRAKMLQAIAREMAAPGSVRYISNLLQQSDHNQDGVLQPDEFKAALKAHDAHSSKSAADAKSTETPLTREHHVRVFTASAIPFVGFGFLDNLIMIVAGDYIDASLGAAFCLSTMAAAGLGNLISDIAGIFCADSIESRARVFKYGRMPRFSTAQAQSPPVTYIKSLGAVVGISIGCILGMFPLLFSTHGHTAPSEAPPACAPDAEPVVIADA
eukprot:jgi/Ulvmu1/6091/UM027_0069.1